MHRRVSVHSLYAWLEAHGWHVRVTIERHRMGAAGEDFDVGTSGATPLSVGPSPRFIHIG